MKSVPTFKCGKYKIRYIQILYDNRYFVYSRLHEYYNKYEDFAKISCISHSLNRDLSNMIINKGCEERPDTVELLDRRKRFDNFLKRVNEKDKWLNRKD